MSLTITIIQSNLSWEDKEANLQMLLQKIESIKEKTEVVILPEMFSTGFSMNTKALGEKMNGKSVEWMKNTAAKNKIIITGSLIIEEEGKYYNRLIWMLPNGQYGYYDKRHLFAYANEHKFYTPGNKRLIASVKGWKINLLICYDLRFPVWTRQKPSAPVSPGEQGDVNSEEEETHTPEYDLMILIANWPERRNAAWQTLLMARAIENQCYVIGVNRVGEDANNINYAGNSMLIDPIGEVLYQKLNKEDVFTFTLQKEKLNEVRKKFPFWKDADEFNL